MVGDNVWVWGRVGRVRGCMVNIYRELWSSMSVYFFDDLVFLKE